MTNAQVALLIASFYIKDTYHNGLTDVKYRADDLLVWLEKKDKENRDRIQKQLNDNLGD